MGSEWALKKAILNVERMYPVVGTLEDLQVSFDVLEKKIPAFFNGITELYKEDLKGTPSTVQKVKRT